MPKSIKFIKKYHGPRCEKCSDKVPYMYVCGACKDEQWFECLEQGWFCPNHSPTNSCDCANCMYPVEEKIADLEASIELAQKQLEYMKK